MNVHVFSSSDVNYDLYKNVLDILIHANSPINFIADDKKYSIDSDDIDEVRFSKRKFEKQQEVKSKFSEGSGVSYSPAAEFIYPDKIRKVSWDVLFENCESYRAANNIPANDWVFLLTDLSNENNWFAASEPNGRFNFFVHTDQWEFFIPCDPRFPIAYEVMVTILHRLMFSNYAELKKFYHQEPKGCVNDFCQNKKDIIFKLRTADICPECQAVLIQKQVNPAMVSQIFKTLDAIRGQMLFRERFKTTQQPSRISIRGPRKRIFFTDLGDAELKLTPLEKIVYLLFLKNEAGLKLNAVYEHKQWLEDTYKFLGNGALAETQRSIEQLVNATENSVSEKISRIKSKTERVTGEELSKFYIIEGERGEKKRIKLDRKLVFYEPDWREN